MAIVASGGLDEDELLALRGAPIDSFGVGTSMTTASDAPALDCAYKLQEYAGKPRRKRSEGKATWPGRKQVWRSRAADGGFSGDLVTLDGEAHQGAALLQPFMRRGGRIAPAKPLQETRAYARDQLGRLPAALRRLEPFTYPVAIGSSLRDLAAALDRSESAGPAAPS